ncbi:MAG TPA: hypothetical protein VNW15_01190 [Rhizomicrobium sp.]|jgi:hypothetical protein|nr:hypothetical protein [Rhizomicrobium sp.]
MENHPKDTAPKQSHVPTISRVCTDTLVELVYDPVARKTALAVSRFGGLWNVEQEVRIETGEILVPYRATNNLIANECVLLPSLPEEFGFKHELIADIRSFLHRYVDLSPAFEQAAAYYVLLSWVHDAFNELPYLRLRGDYGTGKTRALMILGSLCYKSFFASGAASTSPIFHTLDTFGGTLIYDEADLPLSDARADMVKILNTGNLKGIPVLRTIVNRNKEFNPRAFKVFGPKIVAMRGSFEDRALESRFLTEETATHLMRPDVPIILPPAFRVEALTLRNRLLHFRLCHFFDIKADGTALMDKVEPRVNQIALSLLSLADDPDERSAIQDAFIAQHRNAVSARQESIEGHVLAAILKVFRVLTAPHVTLRDVTDNFNRAHCGEYPRPMSNRWIGQIVRARLMLKTERTNGIYVIPVTEWPKVQALASRFGLVTEEQATA